MMSGIAKPIAPFTKPAAKVTPKAIATAQSGKPADIASISVLVVAIGRGRSAFRRLLHRQNAIVIFVLEMRCERIIIALRLQTS
jgi:ribosomal protein S11